VAPPSLGRPESAGWLGRLGRRLLTIVESRSVSESVARWMGQRSRSGRKALFMLQHTFCHLPGITVTTERQLWAAGIDSWETALAVDRGRLPRRHQRALADHLPASIEHLARGNTSHEATPRLLRTDCRCINTGGCSRPFAR